MIGNPLLASNQRAFTLVEVVVAVTLLVSVGAGLLSAFIFAQRVFRDTDRKVNSNLGNLSVVGYLWDNLGASKTKPGGPWDIKQHNPPGGIPSYEVKDVDNRDYVRTIS